MSDKSKSKQSPKKVDDANTDFLHADIGDIEDPILGSVYVVLQWVNGSKREKKNGGIAHTGGFFWQDDLKIEGDEEVTLMTESGAELKGRGIRDLPGSPIRHRRCWDSQSGDGFPVRYGYNEFEDAREAGTSVRGRLHVLWAIPGVDEPVVLTFSGMTTKAVMGQGREPGAIPAYVNTIVRGASRMRRKAVRSENFNYPWCAFQMTLGPERDDKGNPVFTEVGSEQTSLITRPAWVDAVQEIDKAILSRLFVGHERLGLYKAWHREADEWVNQWDDAVLAARRNKIAENGADKPTAEAGSPEAPAGAPQGQSMPF